MPHRPLDRRRFLALLAATPALATVLQGCSDDLDVSARRSDATENDATDGTAGERRSQVARATVDPALAADAATSVNSFGTGLYRRLASERPTENLVLSPASIAIALAMASAGATGATLDEMVATLRVGDLDLHPAMNALDAELAARNRDDVQLSLANSAWLQSTMSIEQPFLDTLAAQYGAGVQTVDFPADTDGARRTINAWVSERTNDRIPDLLPPDTLDEATRFVLVNAVYLNATWAQEFDPNLTRDAPFTTAAGDTVDVPTMAIEREFRYATGDGWQAVELPYVGDELAMLLFLPEPDFLPLFEEIFLVTDATQYLEPRLVRVLLPRWDTASAFSLGEQLEALGMPLAFTDGADFSGITTDEPLRIGSVIHQANITVGEEGTEAAAATAVAGEAGSAPPEDEPVELVFDRPFVFALRDTVSGAVLFLGRVADPRG
jgi:serpin B